MQRPALDNWYASDVLGPYAAFIPTGGWAFARILRSFRLNDFIEAPASGKALAEEGVRCGYWAMGARYRLIWEYLRLAVEPHHDHWQAFVYDEKACEVLYRAERMALHGAKVCAVEFALAHLFGPGHGQDAEGIAERLPWEILDRSSPV